MHRKGRGETVRNLGGTQQNTTEGRTTSKLGGGVLRFVKSGVYRCILQNSYSFFREEKKSFLGFSFKNRASVLFFPFNLILTYSDFNHLHQFVLLHLNCELGIWQLCFLFLQSTVSIASCKEGIELNKDTTIELLKQDKESTLREIENVNKELSQVREELDLKDIRIDKV